MFIVAYLCLILNIVGGVAVFFGYCDSDVCFVLINHVHRPGDTFASGTPNRI
jgi:hypothetical protein